MGRISALFKADEKETESRYAVSEWWLEPKTKGPGAHSHPEDDLFYIIEGTMSVLVGKKWTDAARGSFMLIPGGTTHDFENRSNARAGLLNFKTPGSFEPEIPAIAQWFAENPPGDTED
jgi:mannose-6-phosphate isomerase-like protein (cupin superfamily)